MNTSATNQPLQGIIDSERLKFLIILKFTAAGLSVGMLLLRLPFLQTIPNFGLWADGVSVIVLSSVMVLLWAVLSKNNKLFRMCAVSKTGLDALSLLEQKEEGSGILDLIAQQPQPLKIDSLVTIQKMLSLKPATKGDEIEV